MNTVLVWDTLIGFDTHKGVESLDQQFMTMPLALHLRLTLHRCIPLVMHHKQSMFVMLRIIRVSTIMSCISLGDLWLMLNSLCMRVVNVPNWSRC